MLRLTSGSFSMRRFWISRTMFSSSSIVIAILLAVGLGVLVCGRHALFGHVSTISIGTRLPRFVLEPSVVVDQVGIFVEQFQQADGSFDLREAIRQTRTSRRASIAQATRMATESRSQTSLLGPLGQVAFVAAAVSARLTFDQVVAHRESMQKHRQDREQHATVSITAPAVNMPNFLIGRMSLV